MTKPRHKDGVLLSTLASPAGFPQLAQADGQGPVALNPRTPTIRDK